MAALGEGDAQNAFAYFNRTLELEPKHTAARLKAAELMASSRKVDRCDRRGGKAPERDAAGVVIESGAARLSLAQPPRHNAVSQTTPYGTCRRHLRSRRDT